MCSHGVVIRSRTKNVDAAVAETLPLSAPAGHANMALLSPAADSSLAPAFLLLYRSKLMIARGAPRNSKTQKEKRHVQLRVTCTQQRSPDKGMTHTIAECRARGADYASVDKIFQRAHTQHAM